MNPIKNPFSPGAGSPPPELVGRDPILDQARILLGRTKAGRSEKSVLLTGLRGVGKTVLLNEVERIAHAEDFRVVSFEALRKIFSLTMGYPYFVQEWGYQCWNQAEQSPIELDVVNTATTTVLSRLDENFFRVRFDRLTPSEKNFFRAMAELGAQAQRIGDIADKLEDIGVR